MNSEKGLMEGYREQIQKAVEVCEEWTLLDLVLKILIKSNMKEGKSA